MFTEFRKACRALNIMHGRYKKKFVQVWDKLCKLRGITTSRKTKPEFVFQGTIDDKLTLCW